MDYNDLTVEESIQGTNPITIEYDKTISEALSEMKKNKVHQLIVLENKNIRGTISHKDLLYSSIRDATATKITNFIKHTPSISPDKGIIDVASLLISSNTRGLPVTKNNEIISFISESDLIRTVSEVKDTSIASELMISPVFSINQNESIKKAISIMQTESIHHIPVLNEKTRLIEGMLSAFDIVQNKEFKTEKMSIGDIKGKQENYSSLPVKSFMSELVSYSTPNDTIQNIAKKFIEKNVSSNLVLENNNVIGIITTKDILRYLIRKSTKSEIKVKISGLKNEDTFIINKIVSIAENREKKLKNIVKIIDFSIHVKKQHENYDDRIYIVKTHLDTKKGFYKTTSEDRDINIAFCNALSKLEDLVKKDKTKNIKQIRRKNQ